MKAPKDLKSTTVLRDALFNLDAHSGASADYNRGIIVGIVSAYMSAGYTFNAALRTVANNVRAEHASAFHDALPESWRADL